MAKTKAKAVADATDKLKKLAAVAKTPTAPEPKPEPKRRVRSKGKVADPPSAADAGGAMATTTIAPELDFDVTWANFHKIKELHNLTDKETQEVLLKVVGPDPTGTTFWTAYQKRVKAEVLEETTRAALAAPVVPPTDAKRALEVKSDQPAKRQRQDELAEPDEAHDSEEADETYVEECEEDNEWDDDAIIEEEDLPEIEVRGGTGRDDDQDSPSAGAVAVPVEKPSMQVSPPEPVEPVKLPLDDGVGKDARDELEAKLKTTPTAVRTRVVNHNVRRVEDEDDDFPPSLSRKPSQSLAFLILLLSPPNVVFWFVSA